FFLERYMTAYATEVDEFVEAIVNDTETPVTAQDGLEPVLIGLAATKSVKEHRPVKVEEIRKEYNL
ncbi:MAG: inositol 2-dehydrogenase, partial [Selenomonadaceae bacterium]|nr:inositol 2-dehydrogenase [Selenomonadaceae bacterium]